MANKLNTSTLKLLSIRVPELGDTGLGIICITRLSGGELLDPAVGLGPEAVLLLFLQVLPQLLLLKPKLGYAAMEQEQKAKTEREEKSLSHGGN